MGSSQRRPTVWVLGDQLRRDISSLEDCEPGEVRVLMVESEAKLDSHLWHTQRLHLVLSAMAHFAEELRAEGFEVDHRRASSLSVGLREHCAEHDVSEVRAMGPASWDGWALMEHLGVDLVENGDFLCSRDDFEGWMEGRRQVRMEDFYRWQRRRLDLLVEDGEPVGGRWNFDADNREPPPTDGRAWPELERFELDEIDRAVLDRLPDTWGDPPDGTWPVTRTQALVRLGEFVDSGLALFGPHEDAMLADEWKLAHSALSSSMNIGLLHPREVVDAVVAAWEEEDVPIAGVEGFVRQIVGWREYVWGLYWAWMPEYRDENQLGATRAVPPAFEGRATTEMRCVSSVVGRLEANGYLHHIERLMVLGNLALTAGVDPRAMTEWMWSRFVDGAEWVMVPNVVGMALHADGGRMATKPYASGGAYLDRMSDFCGGCRFDPGKRTGEDACPFTTLYWDFLARNEDSLGSNHRLGLQLGSMRRLGDLDEVRLRAEEVLERLDAGTL